MFMQKMFTNFDTENMRKNTSINIVPKSIFKQFCLCNYNGVEVKKLGHFLLKQNSSLVDFDCIFYYNYKYNEKFDRME